MEIDMELAAKVGVNAAIIYKALLKRQGLCKEFFSYTVEEMRNDTSLTRKSQENAIKILEKQGVIEKKLLRIPATRHFKIIGGVQNG